MLLAESITKLETQSQRERGMEDERKINVSESHAMNGGDGTQSYVQNSSLQRSAVEAAKDIINEEVALKLDIKQLCSASTNTFRIADLGCSTGPNTFLAVQMIIEAVERKYKSQGLISQVPEFQVFFNDLVLNDFNTLFLSLPPNRQFYAAGVPGSFHSHLFPKASLHFAYSSSALHWLSRVPQEVTDNTSPACNRGKIHYIGAKNEVFESYSAQFGRDMESFFNARAQELVGGGLMTLLIAAAPNEFHHPQTNIGAEIDLLGSCLMDMAKMGLVDEAKVDSFNIPAYFTSPKELEAVIKRNKNFSIERMETLQSPRIHVVVADLGKRSMYVRAAFEGLIEKHFGSEILDELFHRYAMKVPESPFFSNPDNQKTTLLFVLLKRSICQAK